MESLIIELLEILRQQDETLSNLLATAREHTAAMTQNAPAAILPVVKQSESLINQLKRQDAKREEIEKQIAREANAEGQITLSQLLGNIGDSQCKAELEQLAEGLKAKFNELAEINKLNGIMAKRGLLFAEQLRNIMQPKTGNTYQETGQVQGRHKSISMMDKTI